MNEFVSLGVVCGLLLRRSAPARVGGRIGRLAVDELRRRRRSASRRPRSRRAARPCRTGAAPSGGRSRRASRRRSSRPEPNLTIPEMLNCLDRPFRLNADRRAPTSRCFFDGRLLVDRRPRRGSRPACPSTRVSGLNGDCAVRDAEAEVRRAAVDDRLRRSSPIRCAVAADAALGLRDVRAARAPSASSDSSNVGVSDASVCDVGRTPTCRVMTTSEPWRTSVKIVSNALSIESVSTNVPLTIATPRTIAIAVSAVRSLRPEQARERDLVTLRELVHRR